MKTIPESRYRRWIQKQGYGNIQIQSVEQGSVLTIPKSDKKQLIVPIGGTVDIQEGQDSNVDKKYFHYTLGSTELRLTSEITKLVFIAEKIRFDDSDSNFRIQKHYLYESVKQIREGFLGWVDAGPDSVWGLLEIEQDLGCYFYCPHTVEIPISQKKTSDVSLLVEFGGVECVQFEGMIEAVNHPIPDWVRDHPLYKNMRIRVFYFVPSWVRKTNVSKSPWDTIELITSSQ